MGLSVLARRLLVFEPLAWAVMLYALWWPEPSRIFALLLIPPILLLRALADSSLSPASTPIQPTWRSPFLLLLVAFFALCLLNIAAAPYRWGIVTASLGPLRLQIEYAFVFISRPVFGAFVLFSLEHYVRRYQRTHLQASVPGASTPILLRVIAGAVVMVAVLTVFGLFATVWSDKSVDFQPLLDRIPRISGIAAVEGGFNVNEIGGALATVTPLMAGLTIAAWRWGGRGRGWQGARWGLALILAALMLALFLGQSRSAIVGVIGALALLFALLLPRGRILVAAYLALGLYTAAEGVVVSKILSPTRDALVTRDEDSLSGRRAIWESALHTILDHSLTGVGINTFRHPGVRVHYWVPGYETKVLPHAHNEWLQIGADLGVPGIIVFNAFYLAAGMMIWRCWRSGDPWVRALAISAGAGLLAHAVFGLADANTLWDRLAFVFWWALGLIAASHAVLPLVQARREAAYAERPASQAILEMQ